MSDRKQLERDAKRALGVERDDRIVQVLPAHPNMRIRARSNAPGAKARLVPVIAIALRPDHHLYPMIICPELGAARAAWSTWGCADCAKRVPTETHSHLASMPGSYVREGDHFVRIHDHYEAELGEVDDDAPEPPADIEVWEAR